MSLKTKLFSLVIVGLLILPILISPSKTGQVLGVNDQATGSVGGDTSSSEQNNNQKTADSGTTQTNSEILKQAKVGEIASGVRDVKNEDNSTAPVPASLTGKIIWDENVKTPVSTDKFGLGSSIKVVNGDKTLKLVVSNTRILSTDTILVLDKKTFLALGGDLEKGELTAEVSVDQ